VKVNIGSTILDTQQKIQINDSSASNQHGVPVKVMEATPMVIGIFNHWPSARQRHVFEVWPGINPNRYRLEVPAWFQIRKDQRKEYLFVLAELRNEHVSNDIIQWVRGAAERQFTEWIRYHQNLFHSIRVITAAYPDQLSEFLQLSPVASDTEVEPGHSP
jgi:hypothetical protein